jgi:hypothetical protein
VSESYEPPYSNNGQGSEPDSRFAVGDRVEVEYRGVWAPGRIVRRAHEGWWEVTFEGLSVIVPPRKLRPAADTQVPVLGADAPVLVAWRGRWYDGRVVQAIAADLWEIAYDGYDATWHEAVGPERVRPRVEAAVIDLAQCVPGSRVQINWKGRWYDGTVVRVAGERLWEVAYAGYDASWNEVVGPERLRAGAPAPVAVQTAQTASTGAYAPGTAVLVQYGAQRWPATIARYAGNGAWEVAYDGLDATWNEVVAQTQLRSRG